MTKNKLEEETNQSYTRTIDANEILKGKIPLDDPHLPEPYLILMDDKPLDKLSKAINIIARKTDYRIAFFSTAIGFGYVIMEQKKKEKEKEKTN